MDDQQPIWRWLLISMMMLSIGTLSFGGFFMFRTVQAVVDAVRDPISLINQLPQATPANTTDADPIKAEGCSYIMLLGGGGKDYDDGSELVDSIMVASICSNPDQIVFISIPRDLMVQTDKFGYRKINTLYILAKHQIGEEHAFDLMLEAAQKVTGLPVQNYAYVDFQGFVKIFDALAGNDGLEINVNPGFVDREYPGPNYSYTTVRFEDGIQKIDGKKALQFVRSRHGVNLTTGEGVASDFDRARRQQQIISLLKDRVKDVLLSNNMEPLVNTTDALKESYKTNLTLRDILTLAGNAKDISTEQIHSIVLKEGPGELLYVPDQATRQRIGSGAWMLLPEGNNFTTIQKYIARVLKNPAQALLGTTPVEILNGTKTVGLAGKYSNKLLEEGITILSQYGIRNTHNKKQYEKTLIIDNSGGSNLELVRTIQQLIGHGEIVAENPEPQLYSRVGITIILGQDSVESSTSTSTISPANVEIENYGQTQ